MPGPCSCSHFVGFCLPNLLKQLPLLDCAGVMGRGLLKTAELSPYPSLAWFAR